MEWDQIFIAFMAGCVVTAGILVVWTKKKQKLTFIHPESGGLV